jgi:hypothetical protein
MKSLFEKSVSEELISRINKLTSKTKSEWGKMSVSQMLVHAQKPFQCAFGEIELKRSVISFIFGPVARKQLLNERPFAKNLPTDKNFIVKNQPDFDSEKRKLISLIERFYNSGAESLTKKPHPFFGKMTTKEWDGLMYKHLDHHLRQFGA